jgi:hydroxymethylpyrimidine/phosphomethylpyrimidine kinase
MIPPPRVLSIAGSDSSGGAGIQADLKTITMLGGYGMTAITAVTAQDSTGVHAVEALPAALVGAQIDACIGDIGVDAIKIGMLGSPEITAVVADRLERLRVPVVFDPVMVATSGSVLADAATIAGFERLMVLATLTTPNTDELIALAEQPVTNELDQADAAEAVMARTGCQALLAKGGHLMFGGEIYGLDINGQAFRHDNATQVFDFLYQLRDGAWSETSWHAPRIETRHTHGTGCTLSSAIALFLGEGLELETAIGKARTFVREALLNAPAYGSGHGPLGHQAVKR